MKLTVNTTYNNWLTLLQDVVDKKVTLDYSQIRTLQADAANWPTCACGETCKTLPRDGRGAPTDPYLREYGVEFSQQINAGRFAAALQTFKYIEQRAAALIADQNRTAKAALLAKKAELDREIARLS